MVLIIILLIIAGVLGAVAWRQEKNKPRDGGHDSHGHGGH